MAPTLLRGSKPPHLRLLKSSLETRLSAKGLRQRGMWGTPTFLPDTSGAPRGNAALDAPASRTGKQRAAYRAATQSVRRFAPTQESGSHQSAIGLLYPLGAWRPIQCRLFRTARSHPMFTLTHLDTPPPESMKSQVLQMVVDYF